MASDLTKGAYSGKETFLYYNSATHASQTWVEIVRARNVTVNQEKSVDPVEFHGASETGHTVGYSGFTGTFEYVRRKGTDAVFSALETARNDGSSIELGQLNGPITDANSTGWQAPVYLGTFSETANGNDGVVVTIEFKKADVFDSTGASIPVDSLSGS